MQNGSNKKAIVVGATSGIGKAVVAELSRLGWEIGIAGRRQGLLQEIQRKNLQVVATEQIDINADDAGEKLTKLIGKTGGMDLYGERVGDRKYERAGIHPDGEHRLPLFRSPSRTAWPHRRHQQHRAYQRSWSRSRLLLIKAVCQPLPRMPVSALPYQRTETHLHHRHPSRIRGNPTACRWRALPTPTACGQGGTYHRPLAPTPPEHRDNRLALPPPRVFLADGAALAVGQDENPIKIGGKDSLIQINFRKFA